jgi:class 3 adenylate cyclase
VAPPRQTRKIVTALFCDVSGSTALGEELDPEVLRGVINPYFAEIRTIIERHGGTVEKFIGDAVMAVFGIPVVQEDDALRAVRAAAEIRERLPAVAAEVGVELRFRTGVNTGSVLAGEGENLAIGDAVNVAARLEQAAAPGEIVLGADTLALVRDAVRVQTLPPLVLKGKSEPVVAFRLEAVDPVAAGVARHLDAPLVGRRRELARLRDAWEATVLDSTCHLFTLLGSAGVGKSRLVGELLAGVGGAATVLRGRCLHYGDGITFWPLVEALMGLDEEAVDVLALLRGDVTATPEELFWEVRRLLESLAAQRPVILHVDDLQWAEPMLLDLVDHVVDLSRGAPILVLCTARPELLEDRPGWAGGKLNASTVLLDSLAEAECAALLQRLAGDLAPAVRERVIAASQGNPLFLEEMAAVQHEHGIVAVPPSIQALLAARLERLAGEERELLERGAVEGEVFHRLSVLALATERLAPVLESQLDGLVRKELIRPHPATGLGDQAFRFRHLLIRDAAYDGLPKAVRADLHERFARWLGEYGAELPEVDEIAGWHLEQAVRYAAELGRAVAGELALSAAAHLHRAGRRARDRGDVAAARNLLDRALALAPADATLRARIAVELAEQLVETAATDRIGELLDAAQGDPAVSAHVELVRFEWLHERSPGESLRQIGPILPGLLERLAAEGDERGLARAHLAAFGVHWLCSRAEAAEREAQLAAHHAARAGDGALRSRALGWYVGTSLWGPMPVAEMARNLVALEAGERGPYLDAWIEIGRGDVARLRGRLDEARRRVRAGMERFAALGMTAVVGACHMLLADIERAGGDPAGAVELLRQGDTILAEIDARSFRSTMQALLAADHARLGAAAAASAAIELAEELTAAEDVVNFVYTHQARARLALADDLVDDAERWARSGVSYAWRTDFCVVRAEAKLTLAEVLSTRGRSEQALTEALDALALLEAKGAALDAARAQAVIDELRARFV